MNGGGSLEGIGPRHAQSGQGWGVPIREKEGGKIPRKKTICGALPVSSLQPFFLAGIPIPPSENPNSERQTNLLKVTEIVSENTHGSALCTHSTSADCVVRSG